MTIREKDFNLVTDLTIFEVTLDETIVDVDVCSTLGEECLEQNIRRYQELLFLIDELKCAVAIT